MRGKCLIATFCLFIAGPFLLYMARDCIHVDLPAWLTAEAATYLAGGSEEVDLRSCVTGEAFLRGEFQAALEVEIEGNMPCKEAALLGSAWLQRMAIETSNVLFNWDCYPTYYGSRFSFYPADDALALSPRAPSYHGFTDFASQLSCLASVIPDVTFCAILPDSSGFSCSNPSFQLTSGSVSSIDICDAMASYIMGEPNAILSLCSYGDAVGFYREFYKTDHHWNGWGTISAYNDVADAMGLARVDDAAPDAQLEGLFMNGSSARNGLMLLNEPVCEPLLDTEGIYVEQGDSATLLSTEGRAILDESGARSQFNFYESWYACGTSGNVTIRCSDHHDGSTALIAGDSFRHSLQWLIARNYDRTVVVDDLFSSSKGNDRLCDLIAETGCDAVFFVGRLSNYQTFMSRYPDYFSSPDSSAYGLL